MAVAMASCSLGLSLNSNSSLKKPLVNPLPTGALVESSPAFGSKSICIAHKGRYGAWTKHYAMLIIWLQITPLLFSSLGMFNALRWSSEFYCFCKGSDGNAIHRIVWFLSFWSFWYSEVLIILMSDAICNFRLFCFECEYMESREDSSIKMSLLILYVLVIK